MIRARRRSEGKAFARAPQVSPASRRESMEVTGSFGAFRSPRVVGVSDDVRIANRNLARSAKREMRRWTATLPKGVNV
jgi:hypothetical protein